MACIHLVYTVRRLHFSILWNKRKSGNFAVQQNQDFDYSFEFAYPILADEFSRIWPTLDWTSIHFPKFDAARHFTSQEEVGGVDNQFFDGVAHLFQHEITKLLTMYRESDHFGAFVVFHIESLYLFWNKLVNDLFFSFSGAFPSFVSRYGTTFTMTRSQINLCERAAFWIRLIYSHSYRFVLCWMTIQFFFQNLPFITVCASKYVDWSRNSSSSRNKARFETNISLFVCSRSQMIAP